MKSTVVKSEISIDRRISLTMDPCAISCGLIQQMMARKVSIHLLEVQDIVGVTILVINLVITTT